MLPTDTRSPASVDPAAHAPIKVLVIANYAPEGQTSMLAYSRLLETALPPQGCEVRVLAPPQRVLRASHAARWGKWLGYIDKFVLFVPTLRAAARWADVVHVADHSNAMYIPRLRARPYVITCHDVIAIQAAHGMVPGWQVGATGRLFQRLIEKGLARADAVACASDFTRRDLLALDIADPQRVTTVTNGLNADFVALDHASAQARIAGFGIGVHSRYLLHVGSDLARKNRQAVLDTFIALRARAGDGHASAAPVDELVFVGAPLSAAMQAQAVAHGVEGRIRILHGVSHEELNALYSRAEALLFPSLNEGFGWPVIEAQACGCPVFTSDLAPMNEIGGTAARYVDPHDAQAMADAICNARSAAGEMRRLGLDNALHYSPQALGAAFVALYRRVMAQRKDSA